MDLNDAVVAAAWAKARELGLDKTGQYPVALDISEVRQMLEAGFAAITSRARLADVIDAAYDDLADAVEDTTLGDVLIRGVMGDARWDEMSARFWDTVDGYMRDAAPGAVAELVRAEVARQLESAGQGAMTRGEPSTRAEAIVATEVTTQLRGQFAPLVKQALDGLAAELRKLSGDAVDAFLKGTGR